MSYAAGGNREPHDVPAPMEGPEALIRDLNENDVLLGRGKGPSQYIGNKRLRDLAMTRKEEYNSVLSYKIKERIGREIYDEIANRGGRFLQEVSSGKVARRNGAREVLYKEVTRKKGEIKCKQLLREKSSGKIDKQGSAEATSSEMNMKNVTEEDRDNDDDAFPPSHDAESETMLSMSTGDVEIGFEGISFPENSQSAGGKEGHDDDDDDDDDAVFPLPRDTISDTMLSMSIGAEEIGFEGICFPENSQSAEEKVAELLPSPLSPNLSPLLPSTTILENLPPIGKLIGPSLLHCQTSIVSSRDTGHIAMFRDEVLHEQAHLLDDDVASSFLTALGLEPGQPRFSHQDEIQEQATLTEEERISILVDKFGDKCSVVEHQSKRRLTDTGSESVSFFVKQMWTEIDMMKAKKKAALLEALEKARPEEFSDSRLEQFLRCDGMNPQLAARRFIEYWNFRRKLFGEDKFTKPMILGEALCDDIAALKAGVFTLLPERDLSGRHLMYIDGTRLSDIEYEPESMVRAYWYLMEIVVQEGGSGCVVLDWLKNATILDFDRHVFLPIIYLCNNCMPIRPLPGHTCCPPKILVWLFKPIAFAMQGRELRTRNTMHDVPPDKVADSLLPFGITKEMLPIHMGGSLQLNPSEWIAKRRAIEMEEIE